MNVSNKTLSVLLLAAIVVSLGGTFISLNKLGSMPVTGYLTENQSGGEVTLNIDEVLSITTTDSNTINFGTCNLANDSEGITINSETQYGTGEPGDAGAGADGGCPAYTTAVPIAVRNNGNLNANVTITVNKVGTNESGTFLNVGETNSSLRYKILNDGYSTYSGGCNGLLGNSTDSTSMSAYKVFESNQTDYNACSDLLTGSSANSILAHFEIVIPRAADAGDTVEVTFTAEHVI